MAALTPMMQQYVEVKEKYKDCILFYRIGDFYEMFFEDAITASKVLEITLTGKDCGQEERAPMCGVPYHACDVYLNKLIENGFKVAICEQVEDPKLAKGLVKRDVIRVVTPGTNMSQAILDENTNNYLMSIYLSKDMSGVSVVDITTGEFKTCRISSIAKLADEINKYSPSEIIGNDDFLNAPLDFEYMKDRQKIAISKTPEHYFNQSICEDVISRQLGTNNMAGLGLSDMPESIYSTGALLQYLHETQKNSLEHINKLEIYSIDDYMIIDSSTRRNLELTETLRDKNKKGSLLWVLDKTKTAMGARLLKNYIEQPLIMEDEINNRLDAIEAFNNDVITRDEIREYLNPIYDMERLMTRISLRTANPRDLIAFKSSLKLLPFIKRLVAAFDTTLFKKMYEDLDELTDLYELLESSINEEPPILIREGGIFKDGYLNDIDVLKNAKTDGKTWLADLEAREREKTGIKNLKVKYNKVFGYYFEVTNSFKSLVPEYFIRKQTLANAERYTSKELDELAGTIIGSEDKLTALEYQEYVKLRDRLAGELVRVQKTAHCIAVLDVMASLSYVAVANNYIRPEISTDGVIDIKDGRHPVVEKMTANDMFIANDTYLNNLESRISIITGPNMAGKSTYMRQTALIVLMAQIGSFVPASHAHIGICDRIFTRVGASDDLASGQSTFMVEMSEVANILRNATKNSLLILDEIGRGTSTYDGLSIAWAVVEYISNSELLGAKTLFATHYHELTELEGKLSSVNNYCIAVKEDGDDIVFLRKIIKGGADRSYGIQVAKLAGVPDIVIKRANEICNTLIDADINTKIKDIKVRNDFSDSKSKKNNKADGQMSLFADFNESAIIQEIKTADLGNMTPMKALLYLNELQERLNK
ncbi:dNA mismatch repair protein MutS [Coprococcus sp. CAG:782]|uniref:DNA mismatch repair protein MutS n=1 Tax=Coprococcus sp. OM04-5BH TaxID=2293093 RepID=UPI0003365344|nr:DNA mismatch repair protein MutS [Coprococcus sp. OM04-5BH]MEE0035058.1 DNA mismatch repair protein MutS [Coprococcus sp.]CCY53384.1 dNA mismatch repair protein MutS [Coprococcus sp. CAG:782]